MSDVVFNATRRLVLGAGSTATLLAAARAISPRGAFAQGAGPEVSKVRLGYITLTDSAPLIIAKEKGLFAKHGLPDAEIVKQPSWGVLRDNIVATGTPAAIDGAHILSPLPYLMHLGKGTPDNKPVPMTILARLNVNGQGISLDQTLIKSGARVDASPMKTVYEKGDIVAMTYPGGTHDLWLRYWLAAGGISPVSDVKTIVVPPPMMVKELKLGSMDTLCVGEPWNARVISQGIGFSACVTGEIWADHPEKALGVRADWVAKNPRAAEALVAAVIEAQQWCDKQENKAEMARIIGAPAWFDVPEADILPRAMGDIDYGDGRKVTGSDLRMKFFANHASYPFRSHDLWFLTEHIRWGILPAGMDTKALIAAVNREDVWRAAAKSLALSEIPTSTSRGVEKFFDGVTFDPDAPEKYLASLKIKAG
jgi:nitrate/nitrite transport system substrate-binding protein